MERGRVFRFTMHSNTGMNYSHHAGSSPSDDEPPSLPAEPKPPRFHIISGSNGTHNRRIPAMDEQLPTSKQVQYLECQKNHAANMGGYALDGCGEFLPSGREGTIEALICAACSCHRNFHRREVEGEHSCDCKFKHHSFASVPAVPSLLSLPSSSHYHIGGPINQSLPLHPDEQYLQSGGSSSRKKRFRTKFTPEQKRKMTYFAESIGWKISKPDGDVVQAICDEIGVDRTVLKVWMHNNKTKKQKDDAELEQHYDSSPEDL